MSKLLSKSKIVLEEVFELIRQEQVILWAGAGLSRYAGYPNAQKLGKLILKTLTPAQRALFQSNQSLDALAEQYVKVTGNKKDQLMAALHPIFSKKPTSIEFHKKLSVIPHIKTIITTNYDSLFEIAYENKIQAIAGSSDLKKINKKQPEVFKIHGDLNHTDNIIISKSDYANFYRLGDENVYWTTVKERIINNNVVFIGYNFGDINIDTIINSISEQLGDNRKKYFLVAPDFKDYEIESLRTRNIQYIDSSGENFITQLIENIKKNIVKDQKLGKIGLDTFNTFLSNHDLTADFLATQTGHAISRIVSIDQKPKQAILSLRANSETEDGFKDFITGKTFGRFDFGNSISEFNMSVSGIRLLDEGDLESLTLVSRPKFETTFAIEFENGFELADLPAKVYISPYKTTIHIEYKGKKIELDFSNDKNEEAFQVHVDFPKPYGRPKEELDAFKLLKYLVGGESFNVFLNNGKVYPGGVTRNEQMFKGMSNYVVYFEMLVAIEKHYKIRFTEIDKITDDTFNIVCSLFHNIENDELFFEIKDPLTATISQNITVELLVELNESAPEELVVEYTDFVLPLYGQTFRFKKRIWRIYDPEIVNLEEILAGSDIVRIGSKSQRGSDQYIATVD